MTIASFSPKIARQGLAGRFEGAMQWFRTIRRFAGVMVGLFLLAQFAGVVSAPLASAHPATAAALSHVHHQGHVDDKAPVHQHGGESGKDADHCCALHAFFAGVLPSAVAIESTALTGLVITPRLAEGSSGVTLATLDRPPKRLP